LRYVTPPARKTELPREVPRQRNMLLNLRNPVFGDKIPRLWNQSSGRRFLFDLMVLRILCGHGGMDGGPIRLTFQTGFAAA